MEPLVEIEESKWVELRDSFLKDWPRGVPGYYWMQTQLDHPNLRKELNFRVYCPYGEFCNGAVVYTDKKSSEQYYGVYLNSDESKPMEEALLKTKIIDWSQPLVFSSSPSKSVKLLESVTSQLGLELNYNWNCSVIRRKESPAYEDIGPVPPGTRLGPVEMKNVEEVDAIWPNKYDASKWIISLMIEHNPSWALYNEENNELIAWVLICEYGFLCHLFCKEAYRRKGYAEFILKTAVNDLKEDDKDAYGFLSTSSERLFKKIGFEFYDKAAWCNTRPSEFKTK